MSKLLLFLSTIFLLQTTANACDFLIAGTLVPTIKAPPLCLEDYFHERDLARKSLYRTSETSPMTRDEVSMQFNDEMVFVLPNSQAPLEKAGRLQLVKSFLQMLNQSLRNEFGSCTLNMFDGERKLSIDDFLSYEREEQGQAGSRLMLRQKDVAQARWELICPDALGKESIEKKGDYFFVFADIYENNGKSDLQGHLARFLWSFQ